MAKLTCIVPARNEAGHLREVIEHVLSVNQIDQVIIVEGGSTDETWAVASRLALENPKMISLLKQDKKGKFNAVLTGARLADGKHIVIWDADGTVPIQDSKRVIEAAINSGEAAMGNRLTGTIEPGAMQFANLLGNWAFAVLWIPILKGSPKDLLCGTKVFPREVFSEMPNWLCEIDPYGDFAIISFAISRSIKIHSVTVDYKARTYGSTNINRWSGGIQLLLTTYRIYLAFYRNKFANV